MRRKKEPAYIQLIVLAAALVVYLTFTALPISKGAQPPDGELHPVSRIVDGDTLKLSSGESVRLIGIDTPELHFSDKLLRDARKSLRDIKTIQALGKRSADFTKKLCRDKKVRLIFDVQKRDKYGRLLAYVYLEDGTFVNARIVEEGYAQVLTITPNVKHADYFLKLERDARTNRRGLWAGTDFQ